MNLGLSGRLLTNAGSAEWNMALDEALLNTAGGSTVTLRFYEWRSPAITIGRFQQYPKAESSVVSVVRRPTGGRAVYHGCDLTYSLILPASALSETSVAGSYRVLMREFLNALREIGVPAAIGSERAPGRTSSADCFATRSGADLAIGDQKLVGSAQLRRGQTVLQQGSIQLWGQHPAHPLIQPATTDHQGYSVTRPQVASAVQQSLRRFIYGEWDEADPSESELIEAEALLTRRYSTAEWNIKGKDTLCKLDS